MAYAAFDAEDIRKPGILQMRDLRIPHNSIEKGITGRKYARLILGAC